MLRFSICTLFYLVSICSFAQSVQVLDLSSSQNTNHEIKEFHYIDTKFDVSGQIKIATLKGTCISSGNETVVQLFYTLWTKSNSLGANSYRIDFFTRDSLDNLYVTVSIYKLSDEELNYNLNLYPKNLVYVFGDLGKINSTEKTVVINGTKIKLNHWEYASYLNEVGQDAEISIEGITGTKVWIKGKAGRLPKHLSLGGFSLGPVVTNEIVGISLNTGKIFPVDLNLGQFLAELLTEKQKINYSTIPITENSEFIQYIDASRVESGHQTGKLILYRRNKKELDLPFEFLINDSIKGSFVPFSYMELEIDISKNPVEICYIKGCEENLKVNLDPAKTKYIECSYSEENSKPTMRVIEEKTGEFNFKQAKYYQDKRNKK